MVPINKIVTSEYSTSMLKYNGVCQGWAWSPTAKYVKHRTVGLENPCSNHVTSSFMLHCSSSVSCVKEYVAVDSGGHLHTNSVQL